MKNAMQLKAVVKNIAKEKKISAQLVLQNYIQDMKRLNLTAFAQLYCAGIGSPVHAEQ